MSNLDTFFLGDNWLCELLTEIDQFANLRELYLVKQGYASNFDIL